MTNFPYILKPKSLTDLLQKIPTMGVPEKLTRGQLSSLGYKSSNDRALIPILRFMKFIDSDGKPTETYMAYRDQSKSASILAECVKEAYSNLFQMYPDAQNKEKDSLRNFFSTSVKGGDRVLTATVDTFKTLCESADFGAPIEPSVLQPIKTTQIRRAPSPLSATGGQGIVIKLNIQLPITDDPTVYDRIFQSFRKNILDQESNSEEND